MSNLLSTFTSGEALRGDLVLIHAFPLDHRLWQHMLDSPPDGFRVIAMDLPGFGSSSIDLAGGRDGYDMDAIADLIAETAKSCGVEEAVFGGCSMGGYACFAVLRSFPEMVSGLLLSDTRATADSNTAREGRMAVIEAVERAGISAVAGSMPDRLLGDTTLKTKPELVEEVRSIITDQSPDAVIGALAAMARRRDSSDLLAAIDVPATVVVGSEDALVTVEEAEGLAAAIPGCELEVLESVGHLPALEAPDEFAEIVGRLVGRVSSP